MEFEQDIMISYAWRDNQPPPLSKQEGWVSGFQEGLEFWLKQIMPRPVKIWRDKNKMPGNKLFADELDGVVNKCAVLLTVMSEPYLSSEWCGRELDNFMKAAEEQGFLSVENNYRVFKINKLPVNRGDIPENLSVITGFDFYEIDSETRITRPIDPTFGEEEKQRFIRKIYDVAISIAGLLQQVDSYEVPATSPTDTTGESPELKEPASPDKSQNEHTIYLPHTTRELRDLRDEIVSELIRRNCKVLPSEQGLFTEAEDFSEAVQTDISQCDLAIHLLGSRFGLVLEGATESVSQIQLRLSARESKSRGIPRLICIPEEAGDPTSRQQIMLDELKRNREALEKADLIEGAADLIKAQIIDFLSEKPASAGSATDESEFIVFLLHEESDKRSVRELRKTLRNLQVNGLPIRIILPVFDGDATALRERHERGLVDCDAIVLFWENGSQAWIESSLVHIRKAPAYGREKEYKRPHLVYLSGKKTTAKEDWWLDFEDGLLERDVTTLNGLENPASEDLIKFITG